MKKGSGENRPLPFCRNFLLPTANSLTASDHRSRRRSEAGWNAMREW